MERFEQRYGWKGLSKDMDGKVWVKIWMERFE